MTRYVSIAAIGMVAGLATAALAQSGSTSGNEQQIADIGKKWEDAYNRKDAASVAALYTANCAEVTTDGITQGRDAVQKRVEGLLKAGFHDLSIGTKGVMFMGNMAFPTGDWSQNVGPQQVHGYWSAVDVRDGDTWKIQRLTIVLVPPPPSQGQAASK